MRDTPSVRARPALVGVIALTLTTLAAANGRTQTLDRDRPGIDYYPPWMTEAQPFVSGRDQDYDIWRDGRFDREDPDFQRWRAEQRRLYGPDWRSRPGVEEEYQIWRDSR